MTADVGIAERAERLVVVLVATGLVGLGVPYVLAVALWLLAVGEPGHRRASGCSTVRRQALAETPWSAVSRRR